MFARSSEPRIGNERYQLVYFLAICLWQKRQVGTLSPMHRKGTNSPFILEVQRRLKASWEHPGLSPSLGFLFRDFSWERKIPDKAIKGNFHFSSLLWILVPVVPLLLTYKAPISPLHQKCSWVSSSLHIPSPRALPLDNYLDTCLISSSPQQQSPLMGTSPRRARWASSEPL